MRQIYLAGLLAGLLVFAPLTSFADQCSQYNTEFERHWCQDGVEGHKKVERELAQRCAKMPDPALCIKMAARLRADMKHKGSNKTTPNYAEICAKATDMPRCIQEAQKASAAMRTMGEEMYAKCNSSKTPQLRKLCLNLMQLEDRGVPPEQEKIWREYAAKQKSEQAERERQRAAKEAERRRTNAAEADYESKLKAAFRTGKSNNLLSVICDVSDIPENRKRQRTERAQQCELMKQMLPGVPPKQFCQMGTALGMEKDDITACERHTGAAEQRAEQQRKQQQKAQDRAAARAEREKQRNTSDDAYVLGIRAAIRAASGQQLVTATCATDKAKPEQQQQAKQLCSTYKQLAPMLSKEDICSLATTLQVTQTDLATCQSHSQ